MLKFTCPNCGVEYESEENIEGMEVECGNCSSSFTVPKSAPAPVTTLHSPAQNPPPAAQEAPSDDGKIVISFDDIPSFSPPPSPPPVSGQAFMPPAGQKLSPRQRRLYADYKTMHDHFTNFPPISLVEAIGTPPEKYIVEYHCRGIERIEHDQIIYRYDHRVEIILSGNYPRTPPKCRMLTTIFHPNIEPAVICIGDHWTASERLCDLVVHIGEIITYQSYNVKSPLDGEAAMWADLHQDLLPIDNCDLMPPEL